MNYDTVQTLFNGSFSLIRRQALNWRKIMFDKFKALHITYLGTWFKSNWGSRWNFVPFKVLISITCFFYESWIWQYGLWSLQTEGTLIFACYWGSPLVQFSKFKNFLWICLFLGKNISNFIPPFENSITRIAIILNDHSKLVLKLCISICGYENSTTPRKEIHEAILWGSSNLRIKKKISLNPVFKEISWHLRTFHSS